MSHQPVSLLTESGSSLGVFMDCPKKYEFSYIKRLSSPFYQESLGYGSLVHSFVEDFHRKAMSNSDLMTSFAGQTLEERAKQWWWIPALTNFSTKSSEESTGASQSEQAPQEISPGIAVVPWWQENLSALQSNTTAMLSCLEDLLKAYPEQAERIKMDAALAVGVGAMWANHWMTKSGDLSPASYSVVEAEPQWEFPLANSTSKSPQRPNSESTDSCPSAWRPTLSAESPHPQSDSRQMIHAGKSDGIIQHRQYGHLLYELKTSGSNKQEAYKHRLELDKQISSNLIAHSVRGMPLKGVLYDLIWKPALRLKVGRKTMPDETLSELYVRILDGIHEAPEDYFERLMVFRSERDLEDYKLDLAGQFDSVQRAYDRGHFYRNTNSCEKFGSLCTFFSACMGGSSDEEEYFRIRESKFPELKGY